MNFESYEIGKDVKKQYLKRTFDILTSLAGIILILPFFLFVALLIELENVLNPSSKGPIIHNETRISQGKPFRIYKFRTVKGYLLKTVKENPENESQSAIQYKPNTLTFVGKLLAKFYLDELPQFFNILKGDMSFVGPRPQLISTYKTHFKTDNPSLRYLKAGLCGLCQASKKNLKLQQALVDAFNTNNMHSKLLRLDSIYFEKYKQYSALKLFFYDLKIILMTFRVIMQAKGLKTFLMENK
ncbi:MAG: sugar transferase [Candidatus Omnitrophota bacterium]